MTATHRLPGDQLETVHIERQRAQAAHDLIDFYNQFSKGDTSRLDAMRKERHGRAQVAVILRRLSTVAKEVDLPEADKVSVQTGCYICMLNPGNHCRPEKPSNVIARNSRRKCSTFSIGVTVKANPR
jgi:Exocyst complex component Sec10